MTIERLIVNGSTSKGDWLDLILSLKDPNSTSIKVLRKIDGSISKARHLRDEYKKINNQWILILNKGKTCHQPIQVAKENKQFVISYC